MKDRIVASSSVAVAAQRARTDETATSSQESRLAAEEGTNMQSLAVLSGGTDSSNDFRPLYIPLHADRRVAEQMVQALRPSLHVCFSVAVCTSIV